MDILSKQEMIENMKAGAGLALHCGQILQIQQLESGGQVNSTQNFFPDLQMAWLIFGMT